MLISTIDGEPLTKCLMLNGVKWQPRGILAGPLLRLASQLEQRAGQSLTGLIYAREDSPHHTSIRSKRVKNAAHAGEFLVEVGAWGQDLSIRSLSDKKYPKFDPRRFEIGIEYNDIWINHVSTRIDATVYVVVGPDAFPADQNCLIECVHCLIDDGLEFVSGAVFEFPLRLGPSSYISHSGSYADPWDWRATPISPDPAEREEGWRVGGPYRVRYKGHSLNHGHLRDLYRCNILSDRSLDFRVGGISLREWIAADPVRGKIEAMAPGFWTWVVLDEHRRYVRRQLDVEGILLASLDLHEYEIVD